jgi:flagellar hook protein FlgE
MMTQAFYSGISGIKTNSTGIDVVSDNIANISTIGYRGYDVEFSSIYEKSLATASSPYESGVGIGVEANATSMRQTNGSLLLADQSTDLAINGDGWFGIQGLDEPVYTRDGTFSFDANDDLVSLDGYHVLGTMGGNISADGVLTQKLETIELGDVGSQQKLRFPKSLTYPVDPSTQAEFSANLGTGEPQNVVTVAATLVDSQSNINRLRLEFTKNAVQTPPGTQWTVEATTQSLDGQTIYDTQTGTLEFDTQGALVSNTLTSIDNNGTPVSIDLGSGYNGIIAIDTPVSTGVSTADGTQAGELVGYAINQNAEVIASFTNGEQSSVGKIAVFHFQNDQGLERLNGSKFQESANSGKPIFYKDSSGQNIAGSEVVNFRLEGSNYDISTGLTELIVLQRSYDANAKSISTADQMMQKALSMDA